jgi:hypothetical protein
MMWQERAGPMAREHLGLLDRVGALMKPVTRRRAPAQPETEQPESAAPPADPGIEPLLARIVRLEALVEGLQDALYRQAQHHDQQLDELRRAIQPHELARVLSADARRRGL